MPFSLAFPRIICPSLSFFHHDTEEKMNTRYFMTSHAEPDENAFETGRPEARCHYIRQGATLSPSRNQNALADDWTKNIKYACNALLPSKAIFCTRSILIHVRAPRDAHELQIIAGGARSQSRTRLLAQAKDSLDWRYITLYPHAM